MKSIELFAAMDVATKTSATGAVTVKYVDRKTYGKVHGFKGAVLDREHLAYRNAMGLAGNVNVGAKMTGGEWLVQQVRSAKNKAGVRTHNVTFIESNSLGYEKPLTMEQVLSSLTAEQLAAQLEKLNAIKAPAAPAQPTA